MNFKLVVFVILALAVLSVADIPPGKQTTVGLYVNAREAYEKWQSDQDAIKILDVRTEAEYIFVGHAPMAYNIPFKFLLGFNKEGAPVMKSNENFVQDVNARFEKSDTIFIMCRSGGRSAAAVNLLAEAGFTHVYTIYDGFEGDALDSPESYNHGKRILNGWKNSGAPWTYDLDVSRIYPTIEKQ